MLILLNGLRATFPILVRKGLGRQRMGVDRSCLLPNAMPAEVVIEGTTLRLARRSDVAVALRVAAQFQRRIAEDDWRPYRSRKDAVRTWTRLGGIRFQVMQALSLLNES